MCDRWSDIVKDLNCKSPEIFNIRHTEKGVRIRHTKRKGGNIHCIMAFKRIQDSPSLTSFLSLDAADGADDRVDAGERVSLSEVEDLNSSDSDFSDAPEDHEKQSKDALERVENRLEDVGVDLDNVEIPNIGTMGSPGGQVEGFAQGNRLDVAGELSSSSLRRSGTFTKEAPRIRVEVRRSPSTDSVDSVANTADSDVTKPHLLVASETAGAGSDDELDLGASSTHIRRSGTFTKEAPSICVEVRRLPSTDSNSSVDSVANTDDSDVTKPHLLLAGQIAGGGSDDEVEGGASSTHIRRTGTFTKDMPTVHIQKTRLSSSDYDSDMDASSVDASDYNFCADKLERSSTFTKPSAPQLGDGGADDDDHPELQKSKTFSKNESLHLSTQNREVEVEDELQKSETFTKDEGEDAADVSSGMRRSRTFTISKLGPDDTEEGKEDEENEDKIARSQHLDVDDPHVNLAVLRDDVDLDETLKASDFLNDSDHSS